MGSNRNRRSYLSVHTCQAATDHVCVTRANSLAGVDVCRDLKHYTSTLRSFCRKCGKSRIASHLSCKETNITPKTNKQHAETNTILWEDSNQTESAHRKQRAFSLCCTKARDRNCATLMEHAALKGLEEQRTCTDGLRVRLREMEGDRNCRLHDDHWNNWALHDTHSWADRDRGRRTCRQTCTIPKTAVTDMRAAGSCWRQKWPWLNRNKWSERKSSL